MSRCHFLPPYLVEQLAASSDDADIAHRGQAARAIDERLRGRRLSAPPRLETVTAAASRDTGEDAWTVHTADNGTSLPGRAVRSSGEPDSGDAAVEEAAAGLEASLLMFGEVFGRSSYDGRGAPVVATVHYEQDYVNAFWDGRQLVFGDGDGKLFVRFTRPVDVLAHEFVHAVTQYTSGFVYEGQPGALNESMSDVFSACVKQRLLGQTAAEADWLVGEGIFTERVNGRALRSLAEPGTAYDDPRVGRDRQVGHMSDYVDTTDDNGGVHINSGIPNRAFYLVASTLGGPSWEPAGRIWYAALTSGITADADFAAFAEATEAAARQTDERARDAVARAWEEVGVEPGDRRRGGGQPVRPQRSRRRVAVRRSGGIAGMTTAGEVDLDTDPRSEEVQLLLTRIDFDSLTGSPGRPDRFVYAIDSEDGEVTIGEESMTPELSRLVSLVLGPDSA